MKRVRGQKCVRPHTRVNVFLASYDHLTNGSYASQISITCTARFCKKLPLTVIIRPYVYTYRIWTNNY